MGYLRIIGRALFGAVLGGIPFDGTGALVGGAAFTFAPIATPFLVPSAGRAKRIRQLIDSPELRPLSGGKAHVASAAGKAMLVDPTMTRLCLIDTSRTPPCCIVDGAEIVSCEILQEGRSIMRTTRNDPLTRAVIGGLLLGGAGAVVGAVSSGSTTVSRSRVSSIDLSVVTLRDGWSRFAVPFLASEARGGSRKARNAMSKAKDWCSYVGVLMQKYAVDAVQGAALSAPDRYSELERLGRMLKDGIISDAEFTAEKARILR